MDFPIIDLMDGDACYAELVRWLHPDGLACPRCHRADRMRVAVPNSAIGLAQAPLPPAETGAEMLEDRLRGCGTRPIDQLARVVTLVV
jgi:hypothetical protein